MNCPGVEYVETSKSKPAVIYDGFKYRIKKRNKTSINWECVNANFCGCKGRLTTTIDGNVSVTCVHGCSPGTGEAAEEFFPLKKAKVEIKKEAEEKQEEDEKKPKRRSRKRKMKNGTAIKNEDTITPEPTDMNDDDQYSGSILKDAEKLKLMLLAWNYHTQTQGRNGDLVESTAARLAAVANSDNMADLWASYHSALGLAGNKATTPASLKSQAPTPPVVSRGEQASPILVSGAASAMDTSAHDETSSSAGGTAKDDDDAMLGDDDDDSDDRVDPQHHDPERLKAFNMFVRLFVDENLDRIVPISKQPKEKIQAIIDSCTRQFPEFAERARKRIRTYLKSCRRNKKVRGEAAPPSTGSGALGAGAAWDAAVRPTPAHLTSIQAEQILAQACENESHNAKRMRLGLEPVSQSMPSLPGTIITDSTASTAQAHPLLSLYTTTTSTSNSHNPGSSPTPSSKIGDHITNSINATIENGISLLNNNSIIKGQNDAGGGGGSKTASPASSPVPLPLYRQNFPQGFGTQTFGRLSHSNATTSSISTTSHSTSTNHQLSNHRDSTSTTNALLSTLGVIGGAAAVNNTGVNAAAVAAYQNALFSAMAAGGHGLAGFAGLGATGLPTITGTVPTDLSMKNASTSTSLPSSLHLNSSLGSISSSGALGHLASPFAPSAQAGAAAKPLLLPHKLSNAEIAAVRQLITGYRESAAFLLRSADELESLLMQQP